MSEEANEKNWKEYDPGKFPRNEARQEEFDTLMDAIGEYANDNFLGMGAWYFYSLQVVPLLEFAREYVNELENWRYNVIPGVMEAEPEDEDVQKISREPLTVGELGFFMKVLQHPSTCCIAHGVLAFDKMRPYLPKPEDFHSRPSEGMNILDVLSHVFGVPAQEVAPGITAFVVPLDVPKGNSDDAFENFLNTGETPTDS